MNSKREKVVVGLSGGLDSSTALFLLKEKGFQPIGVMIKFFTGRTFLPSQDSISLAEKLCQKLKIPFYLLEEKDVFQEKVVSYFFREKRKLRTPNPCLICNRYFKIKKLFDFAKKEKVKWVATGHYALIKGEKLFKAKDLKKDQSYFLSFLPKSYLRRLILPLGELKKSEVLEIARKNYLPFSKKESQDLCFLLKKDKKEIIRDFFGERKGLIKVKESNQEVGWHNGLWFYDLFQRKGIGISQGPWYVVGFDKKKNVLLVSKEKEKLFFKEIIISPYHFFEKPKKEFFAEIKIRSQQKPQKGKIFFLTKDRLKIIFEKPVFAPVPGQFAVFYQKNLCLGSGPIAELIK